MMIESTQVGGARVWRVNGEGRVELLDASLTAARLLRVLKEEVELRAPAFIAVVAGPGTFSAVRVGVIYANLLARWYRVPLFSLTKEEVASTDTLQVWYERLQAGMCVPVGYIAPIYDREPNITTPPHDLFSKKTLV